MDPFILAPTPWHEIQLTPGAQDVNGSLPEVLKQAAELAEREGVRRVRIRLSDGRYPIASPLNLAIPGLEALSIVAEPGATPVLSGGMPLDGFQECTRNGARCWVREMPEIGEGAPYFHQLFVNGKRRPRARWPKVAHETANPDFPRILGAPGQGVEDYLYPLPDVRSNAFYLPPPFSKPWKNLTDVEVVLLHFWTEERFPLLSLNEGNGLAVSSRRSVFYLNEGGGSKRWARFYLENVAEALSEPGEWYLDRADARLYYLPEEDETLANTEIYSPQLLHLMTIRGSASAPCRNVRIEGLTFRHTEWNRSDGGRDLQNWTDDGKASPTDGQLYAGTMQASWGTTGALLLQHAHDCEITGCHFEQLGGYGIEMVAGCKNITVSHNTFTDLGAGGINVKGVNDIARPVIQTESLRLTDNTISHFGRVFPSAVGVQLAHAHDCVVSHNHIHHGYYSGISLGWIWSYDTSVNHHNLIAHNHIHDLGFGWLSDMGGIYLLGAQPGTVIRRNVIHDISGHIYGAWGIYLDQGASHIVIEDNLCRGSLDEPFDIHFGRENIVRNNLFLYGNCSQFCFGKAEEHIGCNVSQNIFISRGKPFLNAGYMMDWKKSDSLRCDLNLYWDDTGASFVVDNQLKDGGQLLSWEDWQGLGHDIASVWADPLLTLHEGGYTLEANSPALKIGFRPFPIEVGPKIKPDANQVTSSNRDF